jgi:hypothetical protein
MKHLFEGVLFLLLSFAQSTATLEKNDEREINMLFSDRNHRQECHENAVVAAWCDPTLMDGLVECVMQPSTNSYACRCGFDPSACPDECIAGDAPVAKTHHGIMRHGVPLDQPNYVLTGDDTLNLPLHHCENNAVVANWCGNLPSLDCLLLLALDEYVCTCYGNVAACPTECVGGGAPDHKTKHGIRCRNIPIDQPNYIILEH